MSCGADRRVSDAARLIPAMIYYVDGAAHKYLLTMIERVGSAMVDLSLILMRAAIDTNLYLAHRSCCRRLRGEYLRQPIKDNTRRYRQMEAVYRPCAEMHRSIVMRR